MDTQATGANADTVERAKSLFSDSILRLNEIDGPYLYDTTVRFALAGADKSVFYEKRLMGVSYSFRYRTSLRQVGSFQPTNHQSQRLG